MASLTDFTTVAPLTVRERQAVVSEIDDKILGFAGPSNRDVTACVCETHRHTDDKGRQHYYRKIEGYTFTELDIETLKQAGVGLVVIEEVDNGRILEFSTDQFRQGVYGGKTGPFKRKGVPVAEALQSWPRSRCTIRKANRNRR